MSTVSNVAFVAFAAHALSARDFGALSLIYVLVASSQLIARAAVGEVLLVTAGSAETTSVRDAIGAALSLGLATAVAILAGAVAIGGVVAQAAWALCPFLPLLFLQDTLRYLVMAEGRPGRALESDALWVVGQLLLSASALAAGRNSIAVVAATWTVSGGCAALLLLLRRPVRLQLGGRRWFRAQRSLAPYYVVEAVAVNGSAQLFAVGVALIAGLEATGALRAATVLFGPMNTLVMAAGVALIPELVRRRQRGDDGLTPAVLISGGLMIITAGWGLALLGSRGLLGAVFGDVWDLASTVAPFFFFRLLLGSASTGPLLWLRATGRGNATTSSRIWTSVITLCAGIAGTLLWGVIGAAAGLVLAQAFNATALWLAALRVGRGQRRSHEQRRSAEPAPVPAARSAATVKGAEFRSAGSVR